MNKNEEILKGFPNNELNKTEQKKFYQEPISYFEYFVVSIVRISYFCSFQLLVVFHSLKNWSKKKIKRKTILFADIWKLFRLMYFREDWKTSCK